MKLYKYVGLFFIASLFGACNDEFIDNVTPSLPDDGTLTLSFQSDKLLPQQVATRLSDPKTEAEKEIKTLHIFFFDETGQYLTGSYLDGYKGGQVGKNGGYCMPGVGSTILKIAHENENFDYPEKAEKATIVAVANMETGWFSIDENTGRPAGIDNLADLEAKVYKPRELTLALPPTGMPMYVRQDGMDLLHGAGEHALTISLKALMARVDVSMTIDSDHSDPSRLLPSFQVAEWKVFNVPTQVSLPDNPTAATDLSADTKTVLTEPDNTTLYNRNGVLNLSFYMFENKQNKVDGFQYPQGITDDEKQRYKPEFANENAAYVQIHGYYSTYNEDGAGGSTYDVTYNLYLGANHTDDFFVKRNCQYKNNVTIKGLIQAGNNPEHITFDTRVNVSQSNPFYVAMLRERDHDAHFCITPMDVYMFDDNGETDNVKMTVEVENPDVNNWIRLEKVPAANMEAGTAPNDKCLATGEPWHAGNGKRRYFTTAMMKGPSYDGLLDEVTLETSRDRVYVYLDEYLNDQVDREANLLLTYQAQDGSTIKKTIKIVQAHLIRVNADGDIIYMEKYEEYLNHYDPLDEFNDSQLYPGLPWGLNGTKIETVYWGPGGLEKPICEPNLNVYNGHEYTGWLLQTAGETVMNLNETPRSAAEYCFNKNKRNSSGIIPYNAGKDWYEARLHIKENKSKWFLPGIRELERAITQQYNSFPEFQGNFYWSCSASEAEGQTSGQDPTRARATKCNPDGSYIESGGQKPEYPASGRALRTEKLRIRAFRVDLNPMEY